MRRRLPNLTRRGKWMHSRKKSLFSNCIRSAVTVVFGLSLAVAAPAQSSGTIDQLFAFPCSGGVSGDICPQGGRPNLIIQASDGNFYGAAQVTDEGVSDPQGGTLFKLTASG